MKRGRRNSKGRKLTKRELDKRLRAVESLSREELRERMGRPEYEEVLAAIFQAVKLPVEHWAFVYVIQSYGDGRIEFEATDEEIALHEEKLLQQGKLQAFLRKSKDGAAAEHCAEVERVITELEAVFLWPDDPTANYVN